MGLSLSNLQMFYGDVMRSMSGATRGMLIAAPGKKFIIADFSAIEARMLSWLAKEQWRLDVFNSHGMIYEACASNMFGIPFQQFVEYKAQHGDHHPYRQKGKVGELACIAKGQLVTTDRGLVPIELVTAHMLVWDGEEFVKHDGCVSRGVKEVIEYDGLIATEDHIVWEEGCQQPAAFGDVARRGARLFRPRHSETDLWERDHHITGTPMAGRLEILQSSDALQSLFRRTLDRTCKPDPRAFERLPKLFAKKSSSAVGSKASASRETALHKSQMQRLPKLRRPRRNVRLQLGRGGRFLDIGEHRNTSPINGVRSHRQRQRLCAWKSTMGDMQRKQPEQKDYRNSPLESARLAVLAECSAENDESRFEQARNFERGAFGRNGEAKKLAVNRGKVEVFDLVNAGPRNRFVVSARLVHNCGYQGGVGALITMGALKDGLTEPELPAIIEKWRDANPAVCSLWREYEQAAIYAVKHSGQVYQAGRCKFLSTGQWLKVKIPSGRIIHYYQPKVAPGVIKWRRPDTGEIVEFEKNQLSYMGEKSLQNATKTWCRVPTYGGKITENIDQGASRDCLRDAMFALEAEGYEIVMHVHDEVVLEVPVNFGSLGEVIEIMSRSLPWAPGLPLRAAGFETDRYKK